MSDFVEVGAIVRRPDRPDWGRGQVQSIIGTRVTVTFEHVGKIVLNVDEVPLAVDMPDWL